MPKITIHCVRHAQGYHNLNTANHKIPDPSLTPLGESQCATLARTFPHNDRITHLVASPLRRTLYTCLLSFPAVVARGCKIVALPELQETSDLPCDTGSPREKLEEEFDADGAAKGVVDLRLVEDGWNSKQGRWSPAAEAIEARARDARIWLRSLGERAMERGEVNADGDVQIVVVTHGGYLHYFTEDWDGCERFTGTGWANTEWRSYEFADTGKEEGDANASLKETKESRLRRLGDDKPLSEAEQRNLRASAEKDWQESGYQKDAAQENAKL